MAILPYDRNKQHLIVPLDAIKNERVTLYSTLSCTTPMSLLEILILIQFFYKFSGWTSKKASCWALLKR